MQRKNLPQELLEEEHSKKMKINNQGHFIVDENK